MSQYIDIFSNFGTSKIEGFINLRYTKYANFLLAGENLYLFSICQNSYLHDWHYILFKLP